MSKNSAKEKLKTPSKKTDVKSKEVIRPSNSKKTSKKEKDDIDFSHVTLFRHPIITITTFFKVLYHLILAVPGFICRHYLLFTLLPSFALAFHFLDGPHT
jgi:hypothetical protein